MQLTAILTPAKEGGFVALNPETGTCTQGESLDEALANLREATELYLEDLQDEFVPKTVISTFEVAVHA